MDEIRQNILREQEVRKARLNAHFEQSFSANGIVNEKGRPEAQPGEHDDLIMGLAITYYIRTQQRFTVEKIEKEENITLPFELETETGELMDGEVIRW